MDRAFQLGNTLYVTLPDVYLSLDGENIVVLQDGKEVRRIPLHNLESILVFGYTGASPALMGSEISHPNISSRQSDWQQTWSRSQSSSFGEPRLYGDNGR